MLTSSAVTPFRLTPPVPAPCTHQVAGVLTNSVWPNAAFGCVGLLGAAFIGALLAIRYRSRRILLFSQAAMLVLYSAFLVIVCGVVMQPTVVDPKVRSCTKGGQRSGDALLP